MGKHYNVVKKIIIIRNLLFVEIMMKYLHVYMERIYQE
jgi:hypothetical protein